MSTACLLPPLTEVSEVPKLCSRSATRRCECADSESWWRRWQRRWWRMLQEPQATGIVGSHGGAWAACLKLTDPFAGATHPEASLSNWMPPRGWEGIWFRGKHRPCLPGPWYSGLQQKYHYIPGRIPGEGMQHLGRHG